MRQVLLPVLTLTLLVGCESVQSEDVLTSGMYADISATSDGTSTVVSTILRMGGKTSNTYVELTGDDALTATTGETTETLEATNLGDVYFYSAGFDAVEEGTEFVVSLTRTVDAGAPQSLATLPAAFQITAPLTTDVLSRANDALVVTWADTAGEPMRLTVDGDCFWSVNDEISTDTGTYTVNAGELEPYEESADTSCDATVTLERLLSGTLDAGYGEGGEVYGIQKRTLTFRSDP